MTKWTPFWDSYKAAIHEDSELSDIDKFTYLRSLLEHTASEAISGLTLTTANYAEAVDILTKRFGDNDRIIESHMEALAGLKAVSSSHKLQALRKLADQIGAHIRGLSALGMQSDSYGRLLTPIIFKMILLICDSEL